MTNYDWMIPTIHGASLSLVNIPLAPYIYMDDYNAKYCPISRTNAIIAPIVLFAASSVLASNFGLHSESQYYKDMTSSYKETTRLLEFAKLGLGCCFFIKGIFNKQYGPSIALATLDYLKGFNFVFDAGVDYWGRESIPYILDNTSSLVGMIGNALMGQVAIEQHDN